MGVKAGVFNEETGKLVCLKMINADNDIMIIADNGIIIRVAADEIRKIGRMCIDPAQLQEVDTTEIALPFGSQDEDFTEDIETGNKIVGFIENDVNDLYLKKEIVNVKIDQVNAYTYNFEDQYKKKEVVLKIVDNSLITETGMTFTDWLLENFGTR